MTTNAPQSATAPVKDAATVVLVRDGRAGVEVFLQRRVQQMAFAGGMTVFPGGGVDPRDDDEDLRWHGPDPRWWGERLGADDRTARTLVCAAVRETFEECGVLLASDPDGNPPDVTGLHAVRARLESRELSLAEFLRGEDLVLRADLLRPLAHWITPVTEPRRYDTRFFLAALPDGQVADDRTSEVTEARWFTAAAALADFTAGRHLLLPPTWAQLRTLAQAPDVARLLTREHEIRPVQPTPGPEGGLRSLRFDGDSDYLAAMPPG